MCITAGDCDAARWMFSVSVTYKRGTDTRERYKRFFSLMGDISEAMQCYDIRGVELGTDVFHADKMKSCGIFIRFNHWILQALTWIFPFDVGQVGRAGVADGQSLLGHTLICIHVHEGGGHRDLRDTDDNGQSGSWFQNVTPKCGHETVAKDVPCWPFEVLGPSGRGYRRCNWTPD